MADVVFDSRENHQKIYTQGTKSVTINSFTFAQTDTVVTHSLGYKPNYRLFYEFSGDVWPVTTNFWDTAKKDVRSNSWSTTSAITLYSDNIEASQETFTVYYRVYEDGDATTPESFSSFKNVERIQKTITGTFEAASGGVVTSEAIPHGLGEKCFSVLRWKDEGSEWFDQDLPNWNAGRTANTNSVPHCDATNAYVETFNSYGAARTIEYEIVLFKLVDDDILFDSREGTFVNFEEGETDIALSGAISAGNNVEFTSTISHSETDTFGNLYITKSSDSTKDYAMSIAPLQLKVPTTGTDFDAVIRTENKSDELEITVDVYNGTGSLETITPDTWTIRYALFKA